MIWYRDALRAMLAKFVISHCIDIRIERKISNTIVSNKTAIWFSCVFSLRQNRRFMKVSIIMGARRYVMNCHLKLKIWVTMWMPAPVIIKYWFWTQSLIFSYLNTLYIIMASRLIRNIIPMKFICLLLC